MKVPGLRTIQALLKINWAYLPLYYIQIFLNLLPNDEVFRTLRAFFLKLLGLQIGQNSRFGKDVFVLNYANLVIGKNTDVSNQVYFACYKKILIGMGCNIGYRSCFITGSHNVESDFMRGRPIDEKNSLPIVIEDFVWIGANVTILPGIRVGRGSVVEACSLVTADVEENSIFSGVPAKKIASLKLLK